MIYLGYTITPVTRRLPCGQHVECVEILGPDGHRNYAESTALAKRAVEVHTQSGFWPKIDEKSAEVGK